jgi:hypothetical protein
MTRKTLPRLMPFRDAAAYAARSHPSQSSLMKRRMWAQQCDPVFGRVKFQRPGCRFARRFWRANAPDLRQVGRAYRAKPHLFQCQDARANRRLFRVATPSVRRGKIREQYAMSATMGRASARPSPENRSYRPIRVLSSYSTQGTPPAGTRAIECPLTKSKSDDVFRGPAVTISQLAPLQPFRPKLVACLPVQETSIARRGPLGRARRTRSGTSQRAPRGPATPLGEVNWTGTSSLSSTAKMLRS